jgi:hypothetical protein
MQHFVRVILDQLRNLLAVDDDWNGRAQMMLFILTVLLITLLAALVISAD